LSAHDGMNSSHASRKVPLRRSYRSEGSQTKEHHDIPPYGSTWNSRRAAIHRAKSRSSPSPLTPQPVATRSSYEGSGWSRSITSAGERRYLSISRLRAGDPRLDLESHAAPVRWCGERERPSACISSHWCQFDFIGISWTMNDALLHGFPRAKIQGIKG